MVIQTDRDKKSTNSIVKWGAGAVLEEEGGSGGEFFPVGKNSPRCTIVSIPDPIDGDYSDFVARAHEALSGIGEKTIPIAIELSVLVPPEIAAEISRDSACDAVYLSGEIPWNSIPEQARAVFFRTTVSPYTSMRGGFVSGKYLLPLSGEWIRQCRRQGMAKPIIVGGGVLRPRDAAALVESGASALCIDTAKRLRPWNVFRIVRRVSRL